MTVAVCTLIDECARLSPEWLCYHIALGATTIFVYSDDPRGTRAEVRSLAPIAEAIEVLAAPPGASPLDALRDCLARTAARPGWLALIGPNDYLNPLVAPTLAGAMAGDRPESLVILGVLRFGLASVGAAPGQAPFERSFTLVMPSTAGDELQPLLARPSTFVAASAQRVGSGGAGTSVAMVVNRYVDDAAALENGGHDTRISRHVARYRALRHLVDMPRSS